MQKNLVKYCFDKKIVAYQCWYRYFDYHNGFYDSIKSMLRSNPKLLPCPQRHWNQGLVGFLPIVKRWMLYYAIDYSSQTFQKLHFFRRLSLDFVYCIKLGVINLVISYSYCLKKMKFKLTELKLFKVNVLVTLLITACTVIT